MSVKRVLAELGGSTGSLRDVLSRGCVDVADRLAAAMTRRPIGDLPEEVKQDPTTWIKPPQWWWGWWGGVLASPEPRSELLATSSSGSGFG